MKKRFAILLVLALLLSIAACGKSPVPTVSNGEKLQFTVIVTHADETEKIFLYETAPGKLGAVLEAEGLIVGSGDGMFHTVDGEKADWNENQSYWAFYVDNEYAVKGIYDTDISNGANYKLVYTIG